MAYCTDCTVLYPNTKLFDWSLQYSPLHDRVRDTPPIMTSLPLTPAAVRWWLGSIHIFFFIPWTPSFNFNLATDTVNEWILRQEKIYDLCVRNCHNFGCGLPNSLGMDGNCHFGPTVNTKSPVCKWKSRSIIALVWPAGKRRHQQDTTTSEYCLLSNFPVLSDLTSGKNF